MIFFDEGKHEYRLDDAEKGVLLISATTLIGKYKPPFDEAFWSLYTALRNLLRMEKKQFSSYMYRFHNFRFSEEEKTEQNIAIIAVKLGIDWNLLEYTRIQVLLEWKNITLNACQRGNVLHLYKEEKHFEKEFFFNDEPTYVYESTGTLYQNILPLLTDRPVIIPELRVANRENGIAGSIDQPIFFTNKEFDINDWKGFSLDTKIATLTGWSTIGEIKKGDSIFDGNGEITKVKNVSEIHYNPCYEIIFDTNEKLVADHEHKWEVVIRKADNKFFEKIMTTQEIHESKEKIIKIKCQSLKLPSSNLPIDPYILGLWLGDGNSHASTVTNINKKTWEEIRNRGYRVGENLAPANKAETRTIYGIREYLVKLNVLKNKHIPDIYLRSSYQQRLDLLRGFMDAGGFFHRKRKRCVMQTTKQWQSNSIMTLVSSLGFKPTLFTTIGKGFGKENIKKYSVCFSPAISPFLTRNEDYLDVIKDSRKLRSDYRYFKSVKEIETVPTKCLEVESDTHTYLVGESYIKTHNTNKEIKTNSKYYMLDPISHIEDCNYWHYALQLSLYSWMLEQEGFLARKLYFTHFKFDDLDNVIGEKVFPVPYLKKEIKMILEHYGANKNNS